jgi:phosphatidylinositol alpha-mannosyltransferase
MAAGTPVVASDIEAFRTVLDGGGALVPLGNASALATVLGELLDDPARREKLAAQARQAVAKFDWPVIAQQILEVYATAIEVHHGAS